MFTVDPKLESNTKPPKGFDNSMEQQEHRHMKLQQPTNDPITMTRNSTDDKEPKICTQRQAQSVQLNDTTRENNSRGGTITITKQSAIQEEPGSAFTAQKPRIPETKRLPTPADLVRGLDEHVIGQNKTKMTLAVGVYNHYKRVHSAELLKNAADRRNQEQMNRSQNVTPMAITSDPNIFSSLKLNHSGSSFVPPDPSPYFRDLSKDHEPFQSSFPSSAAFTEVPGAYDMSQNHINSPSTFAQEIEECEIDKSNIMLLGPTGSGKVRSIVRSNLM